MELESTVSMILIIAKEKESLCQLISVNPRPIENQFEPNYRSLSPTDSSERGKISSRKSNRFHCWDYRLRISGWIGAQKFLTKARKICVAVEKFYSLKDSSSQVSQKNSPPTANFHELFVWMTWWWCSGCLHYAMPPSFFIFLFARFQFWFSLSLRLLASSVGINVKSKLSRK